MEKNLKKNIYIYVYIDIYIYVYIDIYMHTTYMKLTIL